MYDPREDPKKDEGNVMEPISSSSLSTYIEGEHDKYHLENYLFSTA